MSPYGSSKAEGEKKGGGGKKKEKGSIKFLSDLIHSCARRKNRAYLAGKKKKTQLLKGIGSPPAKKKKMNPFFFPSFQKKE